MGFPLIKALFGSEGLLYASGFVTIFNILIWTIGYVVVSGQVDPKQTVKAVVTCPCIIAVVAGLIIYLARIPLPEVLTGPIGAIGDMNTPLSMIITGATIASSDLKKLLKNKNLFLTWGVRMLGVPGGGAADLRPAGPARHRAYHRAAAGSLPLRRHHHDVCHPVPPR